MGQRAVHEVRVAVAARERRGLSRELALVAGLDAPVQDQRVQWPVAGWGGLVHAGMDLGLVWLFKELSH